MRRHKILTRTILMLSIVNVALAAPVAVRDRAEVRLDANVTGNVTAASQKRADPSDKGRSTNVPGPDHAPPPSLDSTSWEDLMRTFGMEEQHGYMGSHSPSPDSSGSLTGSDFVPPSPGSPTGSRLPAGSVPVASSLSPPPPESGPTNVLGPDHAPPPSLDSTSWEELMRTFGMDEQHRYMGSPSPSHYVPPNPGSPTGSRLSVGSMPVASSLSPPPPEGGSMNVPWPDHAPASSPDSTDSIWWQADRTVPYSPDRPGSLTGWNHEPPSPGLPTGPRLPVGSMPVASSLSPPPPESESMNVPWLDHAPPSSPDSTNSIWWQADRTTPYSPDRPGSLTGWNHVPPSPGSPTGPRLPVGLMPVASSLSPPPPPPAHPSQLGPSEDRFPSPSGFSVNPDTLSSTGNQPTPSQSPRVDPEMHSLLNAELFPTEFWDNVLKGKIKRRTSVVNLAQKDPRSRIF